MKSFTTIEVYIVLDPEFIDKLVKHTERFLMSLCIH